MIGGARMPTLLHNLLSFSFSQSCFFSSRPRKYAPPFWFCLLLHFHALPLNATVPFCCSSPALWFLVPCRARYPAAVYHRLGLCRLSPPSSPSFPHSTCSGLAVSLLSCGRRLMILFIFYSFFSTSHFCWVPRCTSSLFASSISRYHNLFTVFPVPCFLLPLFVTPFFLQQTRVWYERLLKNQTPQERTRSMVLPCNSRLSLASRSFHNASTASSHLIFSFPFISVHLYSSLYLPFILHTCMPSETWRYRTMVCLSLDTFFARIAETNYLLLFEFCLWFLTLSCCLSPHPSIQVSMWFLFFASARL